MDIKMQDWEIFIKLFLIYNTFPFIVSFWILQSVQEKIIEIQRMYNIAGRLILKNLRILENHNTNLILVS
jgi:hypothetical protein